MGMRQAPRAVAAIATAASSESPARSPSALTEGEAARFILVGSSVIRANDAKKMLASLSAEPPCDVRTAIDAAIAEACADEPVGILLSGGLDSSLLACIAARAIGVDRIVLCAATGLYATRAERALSSRVAAHLGVELLEVSKPEAWWPSLVAVNRGLRYPVGGAFVGAFATIGQTLASRGLGRVLSGDGADDLFAADQLQIADLIQRRKPLAAWRAAASIAMWFGEKPRKVYVDNGVLPLLMQTSSRAFRRASQRIRTSAYAGSPFVRTRQLDETIGEIGDEVARSWLLPQRSFLSFEAESRWRSTVDAHEATYNLPSTTRLTPFLDSRVVAAVLRRPSTHVAGHIGARDKEDLRRLFADVLPSAVRWHRKTGRPDVVGRAVTIDPTTASTAFERVRDLTGGVLELQPNLLKPDRVPPEMQQAWLRSLYLAAWSEAGS